MSDVLMKKIDHIERLIMELNMKLDNFLGYEELTDEEKKELEVIRRDVKKGGYVGFGGLFGEE